MGERFPPNLLDPNPMVLSLDCATAEGRGAVSDLGFNRGSVGTSVPFPPCAQTIAFHKHSKGIPLGKCRLLCRLAAPFLNPAASPSLLFDCQLSTI